MKNAIHTIQQSKIALDKTFIQFSKKSKRLYGKPVEDLIQKLADTSVEEPDIQELENMTPSPFTEDEQKWLNQAMECYMKQVEMG